MPLNADHGRSIPDQGISRTLVKTVNTCRSMPDQFCLIWHWSALIGIDWHWSELIDIGINARILIGIGHWSRESWLYRLQNMHTYVVTLQENSAKLLKNIAWTRAYFMSGECVKLRYTISQWAISINNPHFTIWTAEFSSQSKSSTHAQRTKCSRV